jgi:class 3 adenylate cyclase/tetratricopeptide (TPR) repeat protein
MPACSTCGFESERPFRFCPRCGTEQIASLSQEIRKTVTVLFCDLTGSTSLGESIDPERLRALLANYFEAMKAIVERHGGTVEKFIGDAVMAVFGVPALHEDDALRAVRSAVDMRDALPGLGLEGRIGVSTGEVVTGTEERLATGDAVNVAARLEQAAQPGEVLIGQPTLALVREAAEVEEVEPLVLKGKAEAVTAFRLLRVHDTPERRHESRFVGRDRELAIIRDAWEGATRDRTCQLVTVIGDAGVGKSRLAAEFLASIGATRLRGRCLPYGDGITYWPIVEVLKQVDGSPPEEAAAVAIRSLLGESDEATSAEEIAWAFRKTLEHAALKDPMVVVFDDIQWGEQTFHDLIEHVALLSTAAPILVLCMARPELSERNPTWPVALGLQPLDDDDVDELIGERITRELRAKISHAAGGNPLFIAEMLAMAADTDGDIVVPPNLQALLAARLDQLDPAERSILECGAVEGEIFHRGAVQALTADEAPVTPRLAALVRKQLIRPDRPQIRGDDGFRFRHLLLRDAAYDALPKATRADLHHRYATWLERHGTDLVELDEVVGYHLEQTHGYRLELGLPDDAELAATARRHLTNAGQRAGRRQDYDVAVSLFERAAALVPLSVFDLLLEAELGDVLLWTQRADDAVRRAETLAERGAAAGDRVVELCGLVRVGTFHLFGLESEETAAKLAALIEEALPVFEAASDPMALYIGYSALGEAEAARGQTDAALEAFERSFAHARRAGYEPSSILAARSWCRFAGTTSVSELLAWLDEIEPAAGPDQFVRAYRAWSLARIGRFDESRAILVEARAAQAERGGGALLANLTAFESVSVELLAGDAAAAAEFGAEGCRLHEELGESGFLAGAAGVHAQALYALDRLDEATGWVDRAWDLDAGDRWSQMTLRQVRAKVLARNGEHAEASRVAREAVALGDGTDLLDSQGGAYADLAEVLTLAGEHHEAAAALEQAIARYERKGNTVLAARSRARLAALRAG